MKVKQWWAVAIGIAVAVWAGGESRAADASGQNSGQSFVVRDARVFDGRRVMQATDVLVVDGRIVAVGSKLKAPAGVPQVNGSGRTLLPGLIDAHTHSYGNARRDAIRFGVTTEMDMFGDWRQIAPARQQRESLAPAAQADLWSAGTLATVPKGHGTEYGFPIPTLTRPDEAAAFVQARIAEGSDYLKIILEDGSAFGHTLPSLDAATTQALVTAAHGAGKMAIAHVATQADAQTAIDARIDGLAHVFMDQPASPALVALARSRGTFVVATLSVAASAGAVGAGKTLSEDTQLKPWLTAAQGDSLRAAFPPSWSKASLFTNAVESTRRLHAAGVPVLAGTDAGNPGTAHGASLHGELALLVQAGLTPMQALTAATALPAQMFKLADRGRIAPGLRADLLLVEGDPTRDITATRAIVGIWKNGAAVDRALLPAELPEPVNQAGVPPDAQVSDFESGEIAVRFGQNWSVTTDQLAGGKSTATQTWQAGGAHGSKGALRVEGQVAPGLPYAWAGSLFMPGEKPFDAVDFSARKTLVFQVRGDARNNGRDLTAMLFSGSAGQRQPAVVAFKAGAQWTEVRIPLAGFQGADLSRLRGLAFTAGLPAGDFMFEIDDVSIE